MDSKPSKFRTLKSFTKKWSSGITAFRVIGDDEHPDRNYIIMSRRLIGKEDKNQSFNLRLSDWIKLKELVEDEAQEYTEWPIQQRTATETDTLSAVNRILSDDPDFLNKILSNPNIKQLTQASFEALNRLGNRIFEIKAKNVEFLLDKVAEAREDELESFVAILNELQIGQVSSIAELVKKKISIIRLLEKLLQQSKTTERQVHELLERNLWLLDNDYDLVRSNKTLHNFLLANARIDPDLNRRPDLILKSFLQDDDHIVIVELKRPTVSLRSDHIGQILDYKGIVQNHNPTIRIVDLHLLGYDVSPNFPRELQDVKIDVLENVIQKKRREFDEFLQVLDNAPDTPLLCP